MKEKGTYLVPTLLAGEWTGGRPTSTRPRSPPRPGPRWRPGSTMFRAAVRLGVKIGFGTDSAVSPHGINAREFALMTGLGMPPIAALKSATSVDAELLGIAAKVGTLEAGQARRPRRHARRPDRGHHGHRAGLLRDEGGQDHQRSVAAEAMTSKQTRATEVVDVSWGRKIRSTSPDLRFIHGRMP